MKIVDFNDGILTLELEFGTLTFDRDVSMRIMEEFASVVERDHLARNFAYDEERVMEVLRLHPDGINLTGIASRVGLSVDETRNVLKVLRTQRKVDRISGTYFDPRQYRSFIQPLTNEQRLEQRPEGLGSRQQAIMDLFEKEGRPLSSYYIYKKLEFGSTEEVSDVMSTLRGRGLVRRAGSDGHYATWEVVA